MKKNLVSTLAIIAAATAVFGMTASADDVKTAEIVLDADNDTIKKVQSKEGVQGVVRKPLIDLTRIGEISWTMPS